MIRVGQLVNERVRELKECMETACLSKLSVDARIALEKFEELSRSYEIRENECKDLRKINQSLKQKLINQIIYSEESESLLTEMLKQMQNKINNRKNISIQTDT